MISAFCPGHVSCVFQPMTSFDAMSAGSRGIGIRLDKGAHATVEPRDDGIVNIFLDGVQSVAHITRMVAEKLAPGMGFDIRITNDLPVSQGFGMSAAGAIAAGLCIAETVGKTRSDAFMAAHSAEVMGGGGLGDVSAIVAGSDIPVRTVPGIPPFGRVENADFRIPKLTLAVIGDEMRTESVLGDQESMKPPIRRTNACSPCRTGSPPNPVWRAPPSGAAYSGLTTSAATPACACWATASSRMPTRRRSGPSSAAVT